MTTKIQCPTCNQSIEIVQPELARTKNSTAQVIFCAVLLIVLMIIAFALLKTAYPKPATLVRWDYTARFISDNTDEMNAYERKQGASSKSTYGLNNDVYYNGRFDLMKLPEMEAGWELCDHFFEPRTDHPKLVLIYRRRNN
jgi:hypothetical protein